MTANKKRAFEDFVSLRFFSRNAKFDEVGKTFDDSWYKKVKGGNKLQKQKGKTESQKYAKTLLEQKVLA